jgi:F-type H+-transporting ATPase subunit gamma
METIEDLKGRIESTADLQSVVKTMKAMAAVKIRQFEKAVEALEEYNRTVEMGLRIVLRSRTEMMVLARPDSKGRFGALVFGSDQGMCGQLNDQIVSYALDSMNRSSQETEKYRHILAVGQRVGGRLEEAGQTVDGFISVPSSVSGIAPKVRELLSRIEQWNREKGLNRVFLYYCRPLSGARFQPHTVNLLPVDKGWLEDIGSEPWPTNMLPLFTMDWDTLFSAMIRQYLLVSLYRAFAESLASENASRLASMQGAEKNIQEQMATLKARFQKRRQMSITEELLDIISGFEALEA